MRLRIENNITAGIFSGLSDEENALESWKLHPNAFGFFLPGREQLEEFLTDCFSRTEGQGTAKENKSAGI